jgi:hypothetical protein
VKVIRCETRLVWWSSAAPLLHCEIRGLSQIFLPLHQQWRTNELCAIILLVVYCMHIELNDVTNNAASESAVHVRCVCRV